MVFRIWDSMPFPAEQPIRTNGHSHSQNADRKQFDTVRADGLCTSWPRSADSYLPVISAILKKI